MGIGDRAISRDSCPHAGELDAFDGPEENETAFVNELAGLRLRGKRSGGRQVICLSPMCLSAAKVDAEAGGAAAVLAEGYVSSLHVS